MAYQYANNRGSLFANKEQTSENSPDYTGEIIVEGIAYFIDGWINEGERSGKYLNLRVKRKDKQPDFTETNKLF